MEKTISHFRLPPIPHHLPLTIPTHIKYFIDVLLTDVDSTINPTKIVMSDDKPLRVYANNPTNGTILVNQDGTVTYTVNSTFVGTDTFTYTLTDTDGLTSNTGQYFFIVAIAFSVDKKS